MPTKTGNGHKVELEQLLEDLKVVVRDGEEILKAGVSTVKERAASTAKSADSYLRENPYRTVAVVFGLGIVLGLAAFGLKRRQSRMDEDYDY